MTNFVRTLGVAALNGFAVQIAGVTGLVSVVTLLLLVFNSNFRTFGVFLFFLAAGAICYFAVKTLIGTVKRGNALIDTVNAKENLALLANDMLGFPSPAFFAFDKTNRKIAVCNSVTGDYTLYDFSYVLAWKYVWDTVIENRRDERTVIGFNGEKIREVTITPVEIRKNFAVVLEVANPAQPLIKFHMANEPMAQKWCAKLGAIFN